MGDGGIGDERWGMGDGDEMGHEELLTADVEARVLAEADRWLRAGLST